VILNITDAIVIHAQDIAGRVPVCISAKCRKLLHLAGLCETCCAPLRSTPKCGQIAEAYTHSIPFL